jgi:hypothetical protein
MDAKCAKNSEVLELIAEDDRVTVDAQVDRLVVVDLEALVLRQQQHGSRYPIAQKGGEQSGAGGSIIANKNRLCFDLILA